MDFPLLDALRCCVSSRETRGQWWEGRGEGNSGQVVWDLMSTVKPLAFPLGEKGVPGGLCTEGGMTRLLSEKVHLAVE